MKTSVCFIIRLPDRQPGPIVFRCRNIGWRFRYFDPLHLQTSRSQSIYLIIDSLAILYLERHFDYRISLFVKVGIQHFLGSHLHLSIIYGGFKSADRLTRTGLRSFRGFPILCMQFKSNCILSLVQPVRWAFLNGLPLALQQDASFRCHFQFIDCRFIYQIHRCRIRIISIKLISFFRESLNHFCVLRIQQALIG